MSLSFVSGHTKAIYTTTLFFSELRKLCFYSEASRRKCGARSAPCAAWTCHVGTNRRRTWPRVDSSLSLSPERERACVRGPSLLLHKLNSPGVVGFFQRRQKRQTRGTDAPRGRKHGEECEQFCVGATAVHQPVPGGGGQFSPAAGADSGLCGGGGEGPRGGGADSRDGLASDGRTLQRYQVRDRRGGGGRGLGRRAGPGDHQGHGYHSAGHGGGAGERGRVCGGRGCGLRGLYGGEQSAVHRETQRQVGVRRLDQRRCRWSFTDRPNFPMFIYDSNMAPPWSFSRFLTDNQFIQDPNPSEQIFGTRIKVILGDENESLYIFRDFLDSDDEVMLFINVLENFYIYIPHFPQFCPQFLAYFFLSLFPKFSLKFPSIVSPKMFSPYFSPFLPNFFPKPPSILSIIQILSLKMSSIQAIFTDKRPYYYLKT